jgi:molybdopterin-guanine dinucleotide biosynthesis protein A
VTRGPSGWILLLPCDLLDYDPAWHRELLHRLQSAPTNTKAIAFFDKSWLPFPALYHTLLLTDLQNAIQTQQLSPRKLLTTLGDSACGISKEGISQIRSINTREELEQYLKSDESPR